MEIVVRYRNRIRRVAHDNMRITARTDRESVRKSNARSFRNCFKNRKDILSRVRTARNQRVGGVLFAVDYARKSVDNNRRFAQYRSQQYSDYASARIFRYRRSMDCHTRIRVYSSNLFACVYLRNRKQGKTV